MQTITFTELDSLEKEINKNKSRNLRGIVTTSENIIVCLYENKKILWYDNVDYFVLSNYRLLVDYLGFKNILLDQIIDVKNTRTIDGYHIYIGLPKYSTEVVGEAALVEKEIKYYLVYFEKSDVTQVTWLTKELIKRVSEAKVRLRSTELNIKVESNDKNDIVDQLSKLTSLYKSGSLTEEEYNKAKEKILKM